MLVLGTDVTASWMMGGAVWVGDRLRAAGCRIEIADARKVKAIAPLARKTDKVDAWVLRAGVAYNPAEAYNDTAPSWMSVASPNAAVDGASEPRPRAVRVPAARVSFKVAQPASLR